jgi:hypothetical protein
VQREQFLLSHDNNEQSNIADSYMYFNDTTKGGVSMATTFMGTRHKITLYVV